MINMISAAMLDAAASRLFYLFVEPEVIMLVLAGTITKIIHITSPSYLYNRISECQDSHSLAASPIGCGVVVLMSEAEGLPWRWAPRWHFKRTAHGKMKQSISDSKESGRSSSWDQHEGDSSHQKDDQNVEEMIETTGFDEEVFTGDLLNGPLLQTN